MDKLIAFFNGKKTYLAAIAAAVAGIYGVSDEVVAGNLEGYVNLAGVVLASMGTVYGRYKATQPKPVVKKKRKPRAKKEVVNVQ